MGRSRTYAVIGITATGKIYPAMNKYEIEVQRIHANRDGEKIIQWNAQTKTGAKIIGDWFVVDKELNRQKYPICPICEGIGETEDYYCHVCKGSGIIPNKKHLSRWQDWQIEMFKEEFEKEYKNKQKIA